LLLSLLELLLLVFGSISLSKIKRNPQRYKGKGLSTLTSIDESFTSSVPSFYFLDQNYPNPFNSATIITFSTKKTGNVELLVHDLLGQKIASLFNNVAAADGNLFDFF
jgi:hypothetical protein